MSRLNTIHNKVKKVLESNPATRGDDWLLIYEIWKEYISMDMPIEEVLLGCSRSLPSFETIRRTRQKVQADNPHLVDEEAREFRKEAEAEYKAYALDKKGVVNCKDCKEMYHCEKTYLGGCTDGKVWEDE